MPATLDTAIIGDFTFSPLPWVRDGDILEEVSRDPNEKTITYKVSEYEDPEHITYHLGDFTSHEEAKQELKKKQYNAYHFDFRIYSKTKDLLRVRTLGFIHGMVGFIHYTIADDVFYRIVLSKDALKGMQSLASLRKENPALAVEKMAEAIKRLLQLGYVNVQPISIYYYTKKRIESWLEHIWVSPQHKGIFLYYKSHKRGYFNMDLLSYIQNISLGDITKDKTRKSFRDFWRVLFEPFSGYEQLQNKIKALHKIDVNREEVEKFSLVHNVPMDIIKMIKNYLGFFSLPSKKLKNEILPSFISDTTFGYGKKWNLLDAIFQHPFSLEDNQFSFSENIRTKIKKGFIKKEAIRKDIMAFKKYFGQLQSDEKEKLLKMMKRFGVRGTWHNRQQHFEYMQHLGFPKSSFFDRMSLSLDDKKWKKEQGQQDIKLKQYALYAEFYQDIYTLIVRKKNIRLNAICSKTLIHRASSLQYHPQQRKLFKFIFPLQDFIL